MIEIHGPVQVTTYHLRRAYMEALYQPIVIGRYEVVSHKELKGHKILPQYDTSMLSSDLRSGDWLDLSGTEFEIKRKIQTMNGIIIYLIDEIAAELEDQESYLRAHEELARIEERQREEQLAHMRYEEQQARQHRRTPAERQQSVQEEYQKGPREITFWKSWKRRKNRDD